MEYRLGFTTGAYLAEKVEYNAGMKTVIATLVDGTKLNFGMKPENVQDFIAYLVYEGCAYLMEDKRFGEASLPNPQYFAADMRPID